MQTPIDATLLSKHAIEILYEDDHFLVVNKPCGLPTHTPDGKTEGVAEILARAGMGKLGIHQRLDAATSGVLAFSKSAQGATRLAKAFELRNVKKTYHAIVCGIPKAPSGEWIHNLVHENGITHESNSGKYAKLRYKLVGTVGPFGILEIDLLTGFTHQIRAQAALMGYPILGDSLYGGGSLFPRLCLHAQRLLLKSEPNLPAFYAPLPKILDKPKHADLFTPILSGAMDRLPSDSNLPDTEAIRLFAPQNSGIPEIIAERIGHVFFIRHIEPNAESLWNERDLRLLLQCGIHVCHCSNACYRVHESSSKRHVCKNFERALKQDIPPFDASENGIFYRFDLSGNATGLYLDQRENRKWIAQNASGNVLNLFAYTCAFSVCAATNPNVVSTTSIDAAPAALKKGKENFELNGLSLNGNRFIKEDAIKYLKKCIQNNILFDTVICDPPTFGRYEKTVFSLEEELQNLLTLCCKVVAPHGKLLFSVNHRKIRLSKLRATCREALRLAKQTPLTMECLVLDDPNAILGVGTDLKTLRLTF